MIFKFYLILFIFYTSTILSKNIADSVSNELNLTKLNSLKTDWNVLTSPLSFYPTNIVNSVNPEFNSLYSLYSESQINSGLDFAEPQIMLNQFQLANNWESQKKYGLFAKYLGIAQFMGVVGLAAIHISKFHAPPKGKANLSNSKIIKP